MDHSGAQMTAGLLEYVAAREAVLAETPERGESSMAVCIAAVRVYLGLPQEPTHEWQFQVAHGDDGDVVYGAPPRRGREESLHAPR